MSRFNIPKPLASIAALSVLFAGSVFAAPPRKPAATPAPPPQAAATDNDHTLAAMQDELDRAKSALEDRKVIDRAKGILMKLKGLTEDEAYVLLRSTAMREKKKIGEIAQSILTASELLK